ncbi:MAG: peptidyl-prolyl cis-trans isomerase [Tannerellaceae bacterium]
MKRILLSTILFLIIFACNDSTQILKTDVVVTVQDHSLTKEEIELSMPKGLSRVDSIVVAENLIKNWIVEQLLYDVAKRNTASQQKEVEQLVEKYEKSLVLNLYQEMLVNERLTPEIKDLDIRSFYEENKERFKLDKNIIKGLFLKIPIDAPNLTQIREWYKSTNERSLENIEKYSIQNASVYDYFYDKWVDFDEVVDKIPIHISDPIKFLREKKNIEVSDSLYVYLLNISETLLIGNSAPYEFAEPMIRELLINQKRLNFIKSIEEDLYNDALRKGVIQYSPDIAVAEKKLN